MQVQCLHLLTQGPALPQGAHLRAQARQEMVCEHVCVGREGAQAAVAGMRMGQARARGIPSLSGVRAWRGLPALLHPLGWNGARHKWKQGCGRLLGTGQPHLCPMQQNGPCVRPRLSPQASPHHSHSPAWHRWASHVPQRCQCPPQHPPPAEAYQPAPASAAAPVHTDPGP